MKKYYKAAFIVLLAALLPTCSALAATQGTIGSPSTGSLVFSVIKPPRVEISGLTDLALTSWHIGDGDIRFTEDVCIYSSRPSGGYTVTATGSGTGGAFTLSNGSAALNFTVNWNSGGVNSLSNTGTALMAGMVSGGLTHAATDSSTCNGTVPGPTARLIVGITNATMVSAVPGQYVGTVTFLVAPN